MILGPIKCIDFFNEEECMKNFELAISSIENGDLDRLQHIISQDPQVISQKNINGQSLLIYSCLAATQDGAIPAKRGTDEQFTAVKLLLDAEANPSEADASGKSSLHVAAISDHFELAKLLIDAGASLEGRLMGAKGGSPLSLAMFYAKSQMSQFLANPPIPYNLRSASALGHDSDIFFDQGNFKSEAAYQVDFYRPTDQFPEWKRTNSRQELLDEALSWSARNEQLSSMSQLVEYGANVNSNPYQGTPLLWSIYSNKVNSAKMLIEYGADPNQKHNFGGSEHGQGATAMHLAAQYGSIECLKLLLEEGANPYIKDDLYDSTPMGWARHEGMESSINLFAEIGVIEKNQGTNF